MAKNFWYDWLVSHVPEPIRSATSRIKRQILCLCDNEPREFEISSSEFALGNFTEKHTIQGVSGVDATSFLKMAKNFVVRKLQEKDNVKFRIVLVCLTERPNASGKKPEVKEAHVSDKTTTKLSDDASEKILESMAKYQKEGSGWRLKRVVELEILTTVYNPVGSSYIPLPEKPKEKMAIINMKNENNECFKWCVTRALNPVEEHQYADF